MQLGKVVENIGRYLIFPLGKIVVYAALPPLAYIHIVIQKQEERRRQHELSKFAMAVLVFFFDWAIFLLSMAAGWSTPSWLGSSRRRKLARLEPQTQMS
ncbi:MAG TPA: hypothetical protein DEP07_01910 [Brevibacillus sp.]|jgi:hypothetical protein|uniref:hypothetical protein n=1 Tax=Brevibacillus parabrevis TaxID=54914 RepID=UPI000ED3D58F|nr:hypothetical protein EDM60_25075 [Brevibacillus parabrevis]HBZ79118.1 hypothetical protein [Brevibacillus sp.]